MCLSGLGFLVFFAAFLFLSADRGRENRFEFNHVEPTSTRPVSFTAPKANVWADLGVDEADEVYNFLAKDWADLNITRTPRHVSDNFIYTLEALQPNKSDVLPYLWSDQAAAPQRWAKAVLSQRLDGKSHYSYHAVGPLPVSSGKARVVPLTYPFTSGRNYIAKDLPDLVSIMNFTQSLAENVSDITVELLGAKVDREDPKGPDSLLAFPRLTWDDAGHLFCWVQLFRPGYNSGANSILPQGIYTRIDAVDNSTALDEAIEWNVGEWFYNGVVYENLDDFRAAIKEPGFHKTPPNLDGPWTDTEDFKSHPDGRELPPPISIQPLGPRYKLDRKERYVSWFGFEFYFASTQATGVSVHDIRFKGERVMYELSLQEAMAHYAGDDPMASGQEFLDSFFGMGTNAFELVPGYDCPGYADYLDSSLHRLGNMERLPNNICLFEFTSDYLLSRHTTQTSVTVSRNTFLTLRSVSTVGNYDYTIDYIFYLDGAIEVKVRASGYIFGAFYARNAEKNEDEYGHRIHDALSSSLHDHVISFKADLDIAGTANDMVRLAVEPVAKAYTWDPPNVKQERNTMHLREYPVEREAGLDWPKNAGEFYLVYSRDQKNKWGERKGYRIVSGTGIGNTPHLTVLNSTLLENAARWAERDLWVVRRKDTEPRGADPFNYIDPTDPLIDFSRIADGEDLLHHQEIRDDREGDDGKEEDYDGDLVVYFNVGSHHIPHSGDLPNTLMHTSASSVLFVPHNFADRDPSRASVQGVRLQLRHKRDGGGFPGQPGGGGGGGDDRSSEEEELRLRGRGDGEEIGRRKGSHHKLRTGANYFGTPYRDGVNVPLEALEPDLEKDYRSGSHRVTDLSFNGTAAGMWFKRP